VQLWINYKMKSVAAMPWSVLTYRAFNTVIDDVFAAIIRMPTAHRLSVFRDDVIFVLYLAQRYWYPVDAARPAEGFDLEESTAEQSAAAEAAAAAAAAKGGEGTAAAAPAPAPQLPVEAAHASAAAADAAGAAGSDGGPRRRHARS